MKHQIDIVLLNPKHASIINHDVNIFLATISLYLLDCSPTRCPSRYSIKKLNLIPINYPAHTGHLSMTDETKHGATGQPITTKDIILETGASITQSFKPIKAICAHLNAFHVYASDPTRSVEANHYCTHLNSDV
jgi:hypothetical protein